MSGNEGWFYVLDKENCTCGAYFEVWLFLCLARWFSNYCFSVDALCIETLAKYDTIQHNPIKSNLQCDYIDKQPRFCEANKCSKSNLSIHTLIEPLTAVACVLLNLVGCWRGHKFMKIFLVCFCWWFILGLSLDFQVFLLCIFGQ